MKGENFSSQINTWGLIGPLSCLFAFFVIFTKGSHTPIFLPLVLLVGVPVCWRFKLWGFFGCSFALFAFLFYKYNQIPLDERFWFLGMGIGVVGALFVYALSNDEVEAIVQVQEIESKSRLENLWRVDEKYKDSMEQLKHREEEIFELKLKLKSFHRLVEMSQHELTIAKDNTDKTLQKIENGDQEKVVEHSLSSIEEKYQKLLKRFTEKTDLIKDTKKKLSFTRAKLSFMQKEYEGMSLCDLGEVESKLKNRLSTQSIAKTDITDKVSNLSKLRLTDY